MGMSEPVDFGESVPLQPDDDNAEGRCALP